MVPMLGSRRLYRSRPGKTGPVPLNFRPRRAAAEVEGEVAVKSVAQFTVSIFCGSYSAVMERIGNDVFGPASSSRIRALNGRYAMYAMMVSPVRSCYESID